MMPRTIVGQTLAALLTVLALCLAVLAYVATQKVMSSRLQAAHDAAEQLTEFSAGLINTGTRLKRGAMIAPQIDALLTAEQLDIVAIRVTHVEGIEVLASTAEGVPEGLLEIVPPADFSEQTNATKSGTFYVVQTPIMLGAGDALQMVGQHAVIWDMSGTRGEVIS